MSWAFSSRFLTFLSDTVSPNSRIRLMAFAAILSFELLHVLNTGQTKKHLALQWLKKIICHATLQPVPCLSQCKTLAYSASARISFGYNATIGSKIVAVPEKRALGEHWLERQ